MTSALSPAPTSARPTSSATSEPEPAPTARQVHRTHRTERRPGRGASSARRSRFIPGDERVRSTGRRPPSRLPPTFGAGQRKGTIMTAVLESRGLGKRYGQRWALADCTLSVPAAHVVGRVGPSGAGMTTLLNLAVGMLAPTSGTIEVLGGRPASGPAQLARVGFVAHDTQVSSGLSVDDHLTLGSRMNPGWDAALARDRIQHLGLDPRQPAGKLSGGQRAQLALTLAVAKRPELLILDEPLASLDPLAPRELLPSLVAFISWRHLSVLLSSHLLSHHIRLSRVCPPLGQCGALVDAFQNKLAGTVAVLEIMGLGSLLLAPGLIGVFWGAPLVTRAIEALSFPLAPNQSVSRAPRMAVK